MTKDPNQQGMALVSILIALAIIGLMWYLALHMNKKDTGTSNTNFIQGAGVDTTSYQGILDSTKKVIKDAEATREQQSF